MCLQVVLIVLSPKWPSALKGVAAAHESANPLRAPDGVSFLSRAATSAVLPFERTGVIISYHRLRCQGGWGIKIERPDFSDRSIWRVMGESSSRSASDLIRSVPVAFRNRRKIPFDFLARSFNRRSVRQCHFHVVSLSRLAVRCLYCSFGQSQVVLRQVEPRLVDGVVRGDFRRRNHAIVDPHALNISKAFVIVVTSSYIEYI